MKVVALAALLLLAPEPKTYEFEYRFPKGLVYEEQSTRGTTVEQIVGARVLRYKLSSDAKLRRTIVAADENQKPTIERVEVLSLTNTTEEHPMDEPGTKADPAQGRTFLWRRMKERWALFTGEDVEVTKKYPRLVDILMTWRDARLPKEPVATGDQWEVPASTFLRLAGNKAPPGVRGVALFTLDKVEEGVASISFEVLFTMRVEGVYQSCRATGTWVFDIANSRDVSFEMRGDLKIEQGREGTGKVAMKRSVTYR